MTQAHDCLALANTNIYVPTLKVILRSLGMGDVVFTFSDSSRLIYCYTSSWRTDRLEVVND